MAKISFFDIDKWCEEAEKQLYTKVRLFTIDVLSTCVRFSPEINVAPYSKGHFIANWHLSPTKTMFTTSASTTAAQKIAEIESTLSLAYFKQYNVVHMTNSLDYADKVENKGWVKTGAYAPIAKTVAEIRTKHF